MDRALQEIPQNKSDRIRKPVACGVLVNLLKNGDPGCRKVMADPANHPLLYSGICDFDSEEVGEKYGAGEHVFCGGKRATATAAALGRSSSLREVQS
jgi:hypothetical protein